ncbi:MAG: amidohydrolase family protein, partial [Bacteroidota bacterium]
GFRALRASQEMDLSPVLAGVPDAAPLVERLTASGAPVFAPLALPDTVEADSVALAVALPTTSPSGASFVSDRRTSSFRDVEAEETAMTVQKRAAVARAEASPSVLAAADVPFAFATFEVKPADIHDNLVRMVAAGLSPDDALAALTTSPAALLGVDREVGSVEVGKLANLVVTSGPLFTDSTQIRHVFVEGVGYELDAGGAPDGADPEAVVVATGTWDFEVVTPAGSQEGTFTLDGSGDALTGSITTDEATPLSTVTLEGNALTMAFTSPDTGPVTVTGIITDDEFSGTVEVGSFGSFPFTATRRPE